MLGDDREHRKHWFIIVSDHGVRVFECGFQNVRHLKTYRFPQMARPVRLRWLCERLAADARRADVARLTIHAAPDDLRCLREEIETHELPAQLVWLRHEPPPVLMPARALHQ